MKVWINFHAFVEYLNFYFYSIDLPTMNIKRVLMELKALYFNGIMLVRQTYPWWDQEYAEKYKFDCCRCFYPPGVHEWSIFNTVLLRFCGFNAVLH